jgi:hypothetical protein
MKKVLTLVLTLASLGIFGSMTEATANTLAAGNPQVRIEIGRRHDDWRWRNRYRVRTQTRIVQRGFRTYREVYQVRLLPDGRTETFLISRERIG